MSENNKNDKRINTEPVLKGGISNTVYIWRAEEKACKKCQALDGREYYNIEDIPDRPHPNCKCYIETQTDDELCDCYDLYEQLEEIMTNFNILESAVGAEIASVENLASQANTSLTELEESLNELSGDYGMHLPECEYNIDADYEQMYAQRFELLTLINDITGLLSPLQTILGTIYSFVSNYIYLLAERDGTMDKFYHSKANCEAAQRGILGTAVATGLSDLKELYDSFTYVHTHKVSKEEALADSQRDQVANNEGRTRGRMYPDCNCEILMWGLRPAHRKEK